MCSTIVNIHTISDDTNSSMNEMMTSDYYLVEISSLFVNVNVNVNVGVNVNVNES